MKSSAPKMESPPSACSANVSFKGDSVRTHKYTFFATVGSALLMVGCVADSGRNAVSGKVPDVFHPPKGQTLAISLAAKGVQIYECRAARSDPNQFEWTLNAPEADLFDRAGRKVGTHSKGPRWNHIDGSSVVGENPRPYVKDTNAIPWLLLGVKKAEGAGVLGKVTSIQRVETVGGKPPSGGCDTSTVGKEIRVPYTATYHFYVSKP